MQTFRFAVPITGWTIFEVDAESGREAIEKILSGDIDDVDRGIGVSYDIDADSNNWRIKSVSDPFDEPDMPFSGSMERKN